jgi:5-formyltetrahydrofolate cyclo-ligase
MTKENQKKTARTEATANRKLLHAKFASSAPLQLAAQVFPVAANGDFRCVSAFFPYQSEIDTRPLLGRLAGEGWTSALPIIVDKQMPLIFGRWYPGEPTALGMWDIPQPTDRAPLVVPDVLLVPMLAFDRKGNRLGYGGGYYDRTIAQLRAKKKIVTIGVAYAGQEVDSVPHDAQDQQVDFIMTEREVIACV